MFENLRFEISKLLCAGAGCRSILSDSQHPLQREGRCYDSGGDVGDGL